MGRPPRKALSARSTTLYSEPAKTGPSRCTLLAPPPILGRYPNLRKALTTAPLAGNRPGLFIFTTVSLAQQAGAGQQRVLIGGGARKGRIHAPKLEKSAG